MLTALLTLTLTQLPTVNDLLDNAEIGDAQQYMQLRSRGGYEAQLVDKVKGNTIIKGTWKITKDTLEVKASGCTGSACKDMKKDYTAKVTVLAGRAMHIDSTAPRPFFQSGSYYCHYLGCEPRVGVEILSKAASLGTMNAIEDHLIGHNRGRNTTVVWIGQRPEGETAKSRIELCGRDPEKAKAGLAELKTDLADAPWFGEYTVVEAPAANCFWDVRLYVRDDVAPPARKRGAK